MFPAVVDRTCAAVVKVDGDRVISFLFDHAQLHALLFSGGAGNVVVVEGSEVVDALHSKKGMLGTAFAVDARPLELGKHYAHEQKHTSASVIDLARESEEFYVLEKDNDILFSLIPLTGWTIIEQSNDLFTMMHRAAALRHRGAKDRSLHRELEKRLLREHKKLSKALEAMKSDVAQADHAAKHRHLADLLLSYSSPQQRDLEEVQLIDWEGAAVTVTLDPTKSIIENAHAYYAKAKRSEESARIRKQRIPITERQLQHVEQKLAELPTITDIRQLESMMKEYEPRGSAQAMATPYRVFELADGHVLYVGKNAANNDQLTMRFAKQNDWWFHARDSSGSHCVLRCPDPKKKPTKQILEEAAGIAAYYSGSRNASWTPVVYTQRKNVRKPKGANIGAVTLDREDVIMVKPGLPSGSQEE